MSHEIRTPMNGIIGLTALLLDGNLNGEQHQQLNLIADAGRSLLAIINDILDLSKVEAGKIDLETIAFRPDALVRGALSLVRAEALKKQIALDIIIAHEVPEWVSGDPTRVRQILLNLLTNALKFTEHGRVGVSVRCDPQAGGDVLRFEISDTGIGIAAESQYLLFEKFSQVDRSSARKFGGTGLGLAISRRLAEAMGGTMGVVSSVDTGSIFWFTAVMPRAASASRSPAEIPLLAQITSRRILVVDDNVINQIVVKGLLVKDGHCVVVVDNGAEALAALQSPSFDLVLMDMQMPVMDGVEATRRIRALHGAAGEVPIVALSANVMAEQIASCRAAGMNDHLAKPIDRVALRQIIATWATCPNPSAGAVDDGNEAAVTGGLHAAIVSLQTDARCIEAGFEAHDDQAVAEAAHRMKGTCGELRATRLREIAWLIERTAKERRAPMPPSLLAELRDALDALRAEVKAQSETQIACR